MKKQRSFGQRQWLGLALLLGVVVVVVVLQVIRRPDTGSGSGPLTLVKGYGGGLKANYFADPDVQAFLADEYGLRVELLPLGSIESLCGQPLGDIDFIWAGDQSSLNLYKECGGTSKRDANVYNSPIVLYSWAPIVDALVAAKVVRVDAQGVYTVDVPALVGLVQRGATWASIGLPNFYGNVKIKATDPARSNSGYQYAGLLATILNGGVAVDEQNVGPLLAQIPPFFGGYMPGTSAAFFQQFLTQGMGAVPIAVGYESQMLEYLLANPSMKSQVTQNVRMLYPQPTVWASHPFIVRTDNGGRLLDALLTDKAQTLAWEHHGNRPGMPSVQIDPSALGVPGVIPSITSAVDMPTTKAMELILAAIASPPAPAPRTASPVAARAAPTPAVV